MSHPQSDAHALEVIQRSIVSEFPLAALVGQEQLKSALLLCAVNPGIGGVVIRGDKGSAKSTAARGLAAVMAPIERVAGCAYNCMPGSRRRPVKSVTTRSRRWRQVPCRS